MQKSIDERGELNLAEVRNVGSEIKFEEEDSSKVLQSFGGGSSLLSNILRVKPIEILSPRRAVQSDPVPVGARTVSALPTSNDRPLIKLEVISSQEMAIVSVLIGFAMMYNIIYLSVVTSFARYRWAVDASCSKFNCRDVILRSDFRIIVWFNFISCSVFTLVALLFSIQMLYTYFFRIERLQRPEVAWSLALILPTVVAANSPVINLDRIHVLPLVGDRERNILAICRYFVTAWSFSTVTLYMALKFGSLERNTDLSNIEYGGWFYFKRTSPAVVLFFGVFVGGLWQHTELSPQPMVPLIALARNRYYGFSFPRGSIAVSVSTGVIQLIFLAFFITRYYIDARKVTQASYREARLKVINIFWLWRHSIVPILTSTVATAACAAVFPPNLTILSGSNRAAFEEKYILDVPYLARSGIVLVYVTWAILECVSALPSVYSPTFLEKMLIDRLGLQAGGAFLPNSQNQHHEGAGASSSAHHCGFPKMKSVQQSTVLREKAMLKESDRRVEISGLESDTESKNNPDGFFEHAKDGKIRMNSPGPVVWKSSDPTSRPSQFRFDECVLSYNMSYLAYLSDHDIAKGLRQFGNGRFSLQRIFRNEERDLVAFVATSAELIVVAFRGTVSMSNARINVQFGHARHLPEEDPEWIQAALKSRSRHPHLPPAVHRGFADAYYALQEGVLSQLKLLYKDRPTKARVLCCGHSLGGALATLCAFDCRVLLNLSDLHVTLVSFGSPRVGNHPFARRFAVTVSDSWRIVNRDDVVTNLPKRHIGTLAYEHIPRCVLFDLAGNLILDPMYSDLKLFHHGGKLQPHTLLSYRNSLEAFVDVANSSTAESSSTRYSPDWWDFATLGNPAESIEAVNAYLDEHI